MLGRAPDGIVAPPGLLTHPARTKHSTCQRATGERATHDTLLLNSRLLSTWTGPWDETTINARSDALVDAVLDTWPVPAGHVGAVVDPHEKSAGWIQVKHLVDAGLLEPGTELSPRAGAWQPRTALVRADGLLEVDGTTFDSPSCAGRFVKNSATNPDCASGGVM